MLGDSSSSSTPVDPPNPPTGGLVQQATDTLRRAQSDIIASDELSERAAAYARQYPVIYAKAKHGASYRVMEARDWPAFLEMAERWPDERHWSNMVRLFLRKLDFAPNNQPGTPRQFLHLAPECDSLIRQATACA